MAPQKVQENSAVPVPAAVRPDVRDETAPLLQDAHSVSGGRADTKKIVARVMIGTVIGALTVTLYVATTSRQDFFVQFSSDVSNGFINAGFGEQTLGAFLPLKNEFSDAIFAGIRSLERQRNRECCKNLLGIIASAVVTSVPALITFKSEMDKSNSFGWGVLFASGNFIGNLPLNFIPMRYIIPGEAKKLARKVYYSSVFGCASRPHKNVYKIQQQAITQLKALRSDLAHSDVKELFSQLGEERLPVDALQRIIHSLREQDASMAIAPSKLLECLAYGRTGLGLIAGLLVAYISAGPACALSQALTQWTLGVSGSTIAYPAYIGYALLSNFVALPLYALSIRAGKALVDNICGRVGSVAKRGWRHLFSNDDTMGAQTTGGKVAAIAVNSLSTAGSAVLACQSGFTADVLFGMCPAQVGRSMVSPLTVFFNAYYVMQTLSRLSHGLAQSIEKKCGGSEHITHYTKLMDAFDALIGYLERLSPSDFAHIWQALPAEVVDVLPRSNQDELRALDRLEHPVERAAP